MPGKHGSDRQKKRFFYLTMDPAGPKIPLAHAAKKLGISPATAYRWRDATAAVTGSDFADRKKIDVLPAPKSWDDLDTDGRACLEDFNLFSEVLFCRRPSPWRYDAAMRAVDALLNKEERSFIDINVFPGAGKSTCFTHDIPAWLAAGGGSLDPAYGRALRFIIGSFTKNVAKHFVARLRRSFELSRPFYDKEQRREAEAVMSIMFGRFKPDTSIGEEKIWAQEQFLLAQLEDVDLYEKEPTFQAASREAGFLGERCDVSIWDDISVRRNSLNPVTAEETNVWFEDEAETRVEPGGVMFLVGQRLTPVDLHRKRLDAKVEDDDGKQVPLYDHVIYPAHWDKLCDGQHRQWDPTNVSGCLTDVNRLSERDWRRVRGKVNYRTVYQQEDADPDLVLVQPMWLEGGIDHDGLEAPGSYDRDRGFWEWPAKQLVGRLVDYVTVDPSAGNFWVAEWWAVQPESRHNYLIEGRRARLQAKDFLDWNNAKQEFSGWMHEMQVKSFELGHPIRVWVIEANAAHKYLFQFEHYRRWRQAFPMVDVIAHQTQLNKLDPELGVQGLMPNRYRTGMKHLPKAPGVESLNYLRVKETELTTYPFSERDDTVLADWIGEWNLDRIISRGRRPMGEDPVAISIPLPKYLRRQQQELRIS